jgi:Cation efflux family
MPEFDHSHVFLAPDHERSERRTWVVIWLCGFMMAAEVAGGLLFGSIALVADGLHMSTHAGALLLAALAYSYSRRHAKDPRFTFGTGKLGDLAGFTSAIVLAMIAILIGYESVGRILHPVAIHFAEAIPIACLGLAMRRRTCSARPMADGCWTLTKQGPRHASGFGAREAMLEKRILRRSRHSVRTGRDRPLLCDPRMAICSPLMRFRSLTSLAHR